MMLIRHNVAKSAAMHLSTLVSKCLNAQVVQLEEASQQQSHRPAGISPQMLFLAAANHAVNC